jgi:multiple sugar transport system ATP-binding protein
VTHDQVEAMTMGDRVAVMRKGRLQQVDDPQTLYDRPVNVFVGGFIGSPAMNMLEVTLHESGGSVVAELGDDRIEVGRETLDARPGLRSYVGRDVIMGIRPEDMEDAALEPDAPDGRRLHGVVRLRESLGSLVMAHMTVSANPAATDVSAELATDVGGDESSRLLGRDDEGTLVTAAFGARSRVKEGDQVEAVVDTRNLHFFDPHTGLGIYDQTTNGSGGTA